jgi:hypothetical protein
VPTLYRKTALIEATQWFKNGDHPHDRVGKQELDEMALLAAHPELLDEVNGMVGPVPDDAPTYERLEGAVVRFFRHPDVSGDAECHYCHAAMHIHGRIDTREGGHIVCPGDWIATGSQGEHWPIKPDVFAADYADTRSAGGGVDENTSDGYHTFKELYRYRLLYNAALFNAWAQYDHADREPLDVHKSTHHSDGEPAFGGGRFVVVAHLPTGQITNHYEMADWDLFRIPERDQAAEWDGHTLTDVVERLERFLRQP